MLSRHAGASPAAPGMPFPWPDEEVSAAAYRLHLYKFTEAQTVYVLERLAAEGVRSVRRVVEAMSPDRLEGLRADYARRTVDPAPARRGDLVRVRTLRRWPWRTSTSQRLGGAVG